MYAIGRCRAATTVIAGFVSAATTTTAHCTAKANWPYSISIPTSSLQLCKLSVSNIYHTSITASCKQARRTSATTERVTFALLPLMCGVSELCCLPSPSRLPPSGADRRQLVWPLAVGARRPGAVWSASTDRLTEILYVGSVRAMHAGITYSEGWKSSLSSCVVRVCVLCGVSGRLYLHRPRQWLVTAPLNVRTGPSLHFPLTRSLQPSEAHHIYADRTPLRSLLTLPRVDVSALCTAVQG